MSNDSHGSPRDRGAADSWYRRPRSPHWWPKGSYNGKCVQVKDMTPEETAEYHAGYDENEEAGGHKDWGGEEV